MILLRMHVTGTKVVVASILSLALISAGCSSKSKEKEEDAAATDDSGIPSYTGEAKNICSDQQFKDSAGKLLKGARDCDMPSNCSKDGELGCVTVAKFKAADVSKLISANIKQGVSLGGVTGSAQVESHSTCSAGGAVGCVTTSTYKAAVTCSADGATGCITTSRYKSADTDAYDAWDIRDGKTIGGISGDLVFYKNMADTTLFDRAAGSGGVAGIDPFDSIDDHNNGGAFPTTAAGSWTQAIGANWIMDTANDDGSGGGTAANDLCDGSEECVFLDQTTGLMWSQQDGINRTWEEAITNCDDLNYGGYVNWRLPTQKELATAYVQGIWSQNAAGKLDLSQTDIWASTTLTTDTTKAWLVSLNDGAAYGWDKTGNTLNVCVRP